MSDVTIHPLTVPTEPGGEGWDDIVALGELGNEIVLEAEGDLDMARTPEELLVMYGTRQYDERAAWLAKVEGRLVGYANLRRPLDADARHVYCFVAVAAMYRRRGIGSMLLQRLLDHATQNGCTTLQSFVIHAGAQAGEQLPARTGRGGVPAANAETQFLLARGFTLEQANVGSALALPADPVRLDALEADAAPHAADYEIITWPSPTPDNLAPGLAHLRQRMSTDLPAGGREASEESWDAARVHGYEATAAAAGRRSLYAAARHRATGRLVAFTEIIVAADRAVSPDQNDTLVLGEHRGHRLGLLVKIANLRVLATERPDASRIKTFNASENDHMLAINERLGFAPIMVSGAWQARIGS